MEECIPVCTPMITRCKLSKDDEANETDQRLYRSMIGSILYVIASSPHIMHDRTCCNISRFPKGNACICSKNIFLDI